MDISATPHPRLCFIRLLDMYVTFPLTVNFYYEAIGLLLQRFMIFKALAAKSWPSPISPSPADLPAKRSERPIF